MADRYVSIGGNNSGPGTSDSPWATLVYAGLTAQSGDTVFVTAGTYSAGCEVSASSVSYIAIGEVNVVGDGFRSCFHIEGKDYIKIQGFNMSNNGGNPFVAASAGVTIRDLNNVGGTGCSYITVSDCTFSGINRREQFTYDYGTPFFVYSFADERLGHTNCNHIVLKDCSFYASKMDTQSGVFHDHVACVGNVSDVLITGCYIYHDFSVYNIRGSTLGFGGGQLLSGYPDYPRRVVVSNNYFEYVGTPLGTVTFPYFTGCKDVLCERNTCVNFGGGIIAVTEDGYNLETRSERQWYRRNLITGVIRNGLTTGTFADTYRSPKNIWATNNTIVKAPIVSGNWLVNLLKLNTTDSPEGVSGDCYFANNIFIGTPLLRDQGAPVVMEYNDENVGRHVRLSNIDRSTPSWYTPGLFGDYEPVNELDINGSPAKYCRGAEELVWEKRIRPRLRR